MTIRLLAVLLVLTVGTLIATPARGVDRLVFGGAEHEVTMVSLVVLKEAYARLGIEVVMDTVPSRRSLVDANAGFTDGDINRVASVERTHLNLLRVPVPVNTIDSVVYSCGKTIDVDGWDSLRGLRIGVMRGIRYAESATFDMQHVTLGKNYDVLFDLLVDDRLDVVITSRPTGYWQRQRTGADCITVNEPPLMHLPLYHFLHLRHADLVPRIAEVLEAMHQSGELETIHRRATREYRANHDR